MAKIGKAVRITHVVNPSLFFCRDMTEAEEESARIEDIENTLAELAKISFDGINQFYVPAVGDTIGYFLESSKKWIRCYVDYYVLLNDQPKAILWAIDYGSPLHTSNFDNMFPLPPNVALLKNKIFKASLGALPARQRFKSTTCEEVTELSRSWTERSVKDFKQWLEEIEESDCVLHFTPSSLSDETDLHVGDLIIYDINKVLSHGMTKTLLHAGYALTVPEEEFKNLYNELDTNIIERWNDNERTGGVLKKPDGIMKIIPLVSKNLKGLDNSGILPSEYLKSVCKKVEDWNVTNDNSSLPSTSGSIFSEGAASTVVGSKVEPPLNERLITKKIELMNLSQLFETRRKVRRLPQAMTSAAGILLHAINQQRKLENSSEDPSLTDQEFVSVSEVGWNTTVQPSERF